MELSDFQKDRKIDPSQLDVECVQQAELTFKWAQASIEAAELEDRAKLALEVLEAQLDSRIRTTPSEFGLEKITEASVKGAVRDNVEYISASERLIEARKRTKLLNAATHAMGEKRRMLQGLIQLHGQQYFAGPNVPRDLISEWKEHQERVSQEVNHLQKQKTRRRQ